MTTVERLVRDAYSAAESYGPATAPPLEPSRRGARVLRPGPGTRPRRLLAPLAAAAAAGLITTGVFIVRDGSTSRGAGALAHPPAPTEVTVFLCARSSGNPSCDGRAATPAQRESLGAALRAYPDVISVSYSSRDQEYKRFQRDLAGSPLTKSVRPGDLPGSFRVRLLSPAAVPAFKEAVSGRPGVDAVINHP